MCYKYIHGPLRGPLYCCDDIPQIALRLPWGSYTIGSATLLIHPIDPIYPIYLIYLFYLFYPIYLIDPIDPVGVGQVVTAVWRAR